MLPKDAEYHIIEQWDNFFARFNPTSDPNAMPQAFSQGNQLGATNGGPVAHDQNPRGY